MALSIPSRRAGRSTPRVGGVPPTRDFYVKRKHTPTHELPRYISFQTQTMHLLSECFSRLAQRLFGASAWQRHRPALHELSDGPLGDGNSRQAHSVY